MAIVPNLNGVQISSQVPLVDPRNLSLKERTFTDDAYATTVQVTLVSGNQALIPAKQTRNQVQFINPVSSNTEVYLSTSPMSAAGGVPLLPGNGFTYRGRTAQLAYYCWGVAGQTLTVMEG